MRSLSLISRPVRAAVRLPPAESPVTIIRVGFISNLNDEITEDLLEVSQKPHISLKAVIETSGVRMVWCFSIV